MSEDAAHEEADAAEQNQNARQYEHDSENKGKSQDHENDAKNDRRCVLENMYGAGPKIGSHSTPSNQRTAREALVPSGQACIFAENRHHTVTPTGAFVCRVRR